MYEVLDECRGSKDDLQAQKGFKYNLKHLDLVQTKYICYICFSLMLIFSLLFPTFNNIAIFKFNNIAVFKRVIDSYTCLFTKLYEERSK